MALIEPKRHEIEVSEQDLDAVRGLIAANKMVPALAAINRYLKDHPDDAAAWFERGRIALEMNTPTDAWLIFSHCARQPGAEEDWRVWTNLGQAFGYLYEWDRAERCHRQAVELTGGTGKLALVALGTCLVGQHKSEEAIQILEKAIELYPEAKMARNSLGYAYLQLRDWGRGWDCYEEGYGAMATRTERRYKQEGRWAGELGKDVRLIIHGEQGIGDQIAGLEPLRDVASRVTVEAVDVSPKIANLIQRSFPDLAVYGTVGSTDIVWPNKCSPTAHTGLFQLHRHFRRSESDYTGRPFLTACPQRRLGYRAILDSLGPGPKIGIAWTGGTSGTHKAHRDSSLEDFTPILRQRAQFVSLEYRDRKEQIDAYKAARRIKVHHLPWAAEAADYDETAALVAELDLVITVPTSVVHLAGGLGVPTWCMVHENPNIHYTSIGDRLAYYGDTVQLVRRADNHWRDCIKEIANQLAGWIDERKAA